jgi:hypothetical protein
MKRFLTALGLGAAISLICVGPANAAPTPVQQFQVNNFFAEATWIIDTDNPQHFVSVAVGQGHSWTPRIRQFNLRTTATSRP